MKRLLFLLCLLFPLLPSCKETGVILGDAQPEAYLPLLQGNRVALFSNQTGVVGDKVVSGGIDDRYDGKGNRSLVPFGTPETGEHILDALLRQGVDVTAVFSPEHGFRGTADAGEHVSGETDPKTGVPILSLYGGGVQLDSATMARFDVLAVDIQDVGLRYYTYYVTMKRLISACAEFGKKVVILDRPNPNGFYVDGPILDMAYKSGVGGLPIPIVHGMTLGELALMMNGEGWLDEGRQADITVVPCRNYTHGTKYELILAPSPNLKNMQAVYLYASTCFFEGTCVSLGRGTDWPFEIYGHPDMKGCDFEFTPQSVDGAKNPPLLGQFCHGRDLRGLTDEEIWKKGVDMSYVVDAYTNLGIGADFFGNGRFFKLLTGSSKEYDAILSGRTAAEIEALWADDVAAFKAQRAPYLLYEDSGISPHEYVSQRPPVEKRLFVSQAVEAKIEEVAAQLTHPKLRWMFVNCMPNTLDTTVHVKDDDADGEPDTYVYTGDIPAMWLRDSGAQVWPYVALCQNDPALKRMIAGVILRQFRLIAIDPYANAFNDGPTGVAGDAGDQTGSPQDPWVFERKWEIDSHCYPVRLAYHYWKTTGDTSIFGKIWLDAIRTTLKTFREQQRKDGDGPYFFLRETDRQLDTKVRVGWGHPVRPVGLIASSFRPSDDATQFEFLVPSNLFAVSILRKAAEILSTVNQEPGLAAECRDLADEVEGALKQYAVFDRSGYGPVWAYEVDGCGNAYFMDDANVPSLLSLPYLECCDADDPVYRNTRRLVWSEDNPYFMRGKAGEGIGGPHIGTHVIWPMSIMMRAFTSNDDEEIRWCLRTLLATDAGKGFIHESFDRDDASVYTRDWFAWQNTLFGELVVKLVDEGRLDLLNNL